MSCPAGLVVGCLSEVHAALTERHWAPGQKRPYPPLDLRDTYPAESLQLARQFLTQSADADYFHKGRVREGGPAFVFGTLGRLGDRSDIEVVRRMGRGHRYSSYALAALKALDTA